MQEELDQKWDSAEFFGNFKQIERFKFKFN